MTKQLFAAALLLVSVSLLAQSTSTAHDDHMAAAPAPAAANWAKARLEASPRHREWVNVKSGSRTVSTFVVYPEVKNKATAVVVVHEIFGMSDWAQLMADELAEAGDVAIAPDLHSGVGPDERCATSCAGGRVSR